MRTTFVLTFIAAALAASASAQTAIPPRTLQLTVDEAVKMALDNNVDLRADRLDPQISDTRVAAAVGAFRPTITSSVQRNSQLQPPTNFLIPTPTSTAAVTSSVGFNQRLSRFGTSYNVAWSATHTDSNSVLSSFNPVLQSGLSLGVSQPLFRDFGIDGSRQQLATSRINRDIADTRLRESLVHTTAGVKAAYWNLASAIANVEARRSALALAEELTRVNRAKVDVGQSPALDLLSAQAEVAANQEQLIIAETAVKQAEDRLRMLIFDPTDREIWNVRLEPVDSPPVGTMAPDLDAAITTALKDRADLLRARKDIDTSATNVRYANNQRLPDVRANLSYTASGLGGTQVLRAVPFGPVTSTGTVTGLGDVLGQVGRLDYPTWAVGVSVSYPIGQTSDQAAYTRARIESTQADERLKGAEARAIQQVRDAGWKIEMNAKRVETTRVARDLAEQRLDAERKRFEVGMSTSFLVVQAQRDLAQAKQNELAAVLAYDLSLVDFEALQQAGPAGQSSGATGGAAQGG
ncbi:MAG: TolC family protein, partial [Vicinamibacterales bacterium]